MRDGQIAICGEQSVYFLRKNYDPPLYLSLCNKHYNIAYTNGHLYTEMTMHDYIVAKIHES